MELVYRNFGSKAAQGLGRKSSVTIMHGLLGNKNNWGQLCSKMLLHEELKECCGHIFSLDLRNHGESPHTLEHSLDLMADDLDLFLENHVKRTTLGIDKDAGRDPLTMNALGTDETKADDMDVQGSVVIGHSMGGSALMHAMLRQYGRLGMERRRIQAENEGLGLPGIPVDGQPLVYKNSNPNPLWGRKKPAIIRGGIVVDICPFRRPPATVSKLTRYLDALHDLPLKEMKSVSQADAILKDLIPERNLRSFMLTNLRFYDKRKHPGKEGAYWMANVQTLKESLASVTLGHDPHDYSEEYGKCDIPVLFVFGKNSEYCQSEGRAAIRQYFSNVEKVEIPDAGHFVHYEQKDRFVDAVAPFIREVMLSNTNGE